MLATDAETEASKITWTSSNTDIAEVTKTGKTTTITGKAPGHAVITATYGKITAECSVTVKEAYVLELTDSKTGTAENYIIYGNSIQEYGIELYNATTVPLVEKGFYLTPNGSTGYSSVWSITDYLPVDGYSFTLKNVRGNAPAICAYDENKNLITGVQYNLGVSGVLGDKIIESTTKIKYIRYSVQPDTWTETHGILVENLTSSYPIEIESVGDLVISEADQNYGKYKISLRISDKVGNQITTNIYLDEPLRKLGQYSDYIDFKNQKVVRKIYEYTLNGTEEFTRTYGENLFDVQGMFSSNPFIVGYGLSNYYRYNSIQSGINANTVNGEFALQNGSNLFFKDSNYSSSASFKENLRNLYLAGKPVKVYYPMVTPTEEALELPALQIFDGYTKVEVLTEIAPSNMEVELPDETQEITFTITNGDEVRTYCAEKGTTFNDWIKTSYNTDEWEYVDYDESNSWYRMWVTEPNQSEESVWVITGSDGNVALEQGTNINATWDFS